MIGSPAKFGHPLHSEVEAEDRLRALWGKVQLAVCNEPGHERPLGVCISGVCAA